MNHLAAGALFILGAAAALAVVAGAALLTLRLWRELRLTRLGWWLWLHWPTRRRP